jgi:hypothetical protein
MDRTDPASPPVDFPLYGLDRDWPGLRWLDSYGGRSGTPTTDVWLGHRSTDGEVAVRVGTFPRQRFEATHSRDVAGELAFAGAVALVNMTLPQGAEQGMPGLNKALVEYAGEQCHRHADWPRTRWSVDGAPVDAAVWRFAGAWLGITDAQPQVYLAVIGFGVVPEGLPLARVTDGAPYGTDLARPLTTDLLQEQRERLPMVVWPLRDQHSYHPDQLAVAQRSAIAR